MNARELKAYLDSLPPEVRASVLEGTRTFGDYVSKAHRVRERIREEFPNLNPRLRAVMSFIAARIL